jgi:hypothetical protein
MDGRSCRLTAHCQTSARRQTRAASGTGSTGSVSGPAGSPAGSRGRLRTSPAARRSRTTTGTTAGSSGGTASRRSPRTGRWACPRGPTATACPLGTSTRSSSRSRRSNRPRRSSGCVVSKETCRLRHHLVPWTAIRVRQHAADFDAATGYCEHTVVAAARAGVVVVVRVADGPDLRVVDAPATQAEARQVLSAGLAPRLVVVREVDRVAHAWRRVAAAPTGVEGRRDAEGRAGGRLPHRPSRWFAWLTERGYSVKCCSTTYAATSLVSQPESPQQSTPGFQRGIDAKH